MEENSMSDFGMNEMQEMQKHCRKNTNKNGNPSARQQDRINCFGWLGEVGEVIDIVKKNGAADAVEKEDLRKHLVEEMADVLMYYNDVMLCYGITAEELKAAYTEKFEKNMKRW